MIKIQEKKIKQIGNIARHRTSTRKNPQRCRVYLTKNCLSPTINCCEGGGLQPYIVIIKRRNTKE